MSKHTKIECTISSSWREITLTGSVTAWETDGRGNRVQPEQKTTLAKVNLLAEPKRARKLARLLGVESEVASLFEQQAEEARDAAQRARDDEKSEAMRKANSRVEAEQRAAAMDDALKVWA